MTTDLFTVLTTFGFMRGVVNESTVYNSNQSGKWLEDSNIAELPCVSGSESLWF